MCEECYPYCTTTIVSSVDVMIVSIFIVVIIFTIFFLLRYALRKCLKEKQ